MIQKNRQKSIHEASDFKLEYGTTAASVAPQSTPELTRILRWGGGIVLAIAAITFMYQGVYSFTPMTRHWIMLAICGLLGLLGVATGTLLNDEKGARTFLGFSAATFPVVASQLGAMFFSLFGHPPLGMPTPLVFSLMTSSKVMAVAGLTLAVLVPVSYLAFRILARSKAVLLTGVFTIANLCILIPIREGLGVCAIISVTAALIYWIDSTLLGRDFRLDSFEGRAARLMLIGPLAVLLGRTLFYSVGSNFYGFMLALAGAYLAFHWGRLAQKTVIRGLCQISGLIGLASGWLICLLSYPGIFFLSQGSMAYLILLPIAAVLGIQSLIIDDSWAVTYQNAAAVLSLLAVVAAHWFEPSPVISIVGVLTAVATVASGTLVGEESIFIFGLLMALISLGNFGLQAFRMHNCYAWAALALIGIGVMFSASLIEKGYTRRFFKGGSLWGKFKTRPDYH